MLSGMPGEALHKQGAEGARRAKLWLESTTRAVVPWVNPEEPAIAKLTFEWADGNPYSYDLGGQFRGGPRDGEEFLAEVKKYKASQDQPDLFREFLAKSYRALMLRPDRCDNFLWITWAPFNATDWDKLRTADWVADGVTRHLQRTLGADKESADIDDEHCEVVANRTWLLVISDRQEEHLTLTREHLGVINKYIISGIAD